MEVNDGGSSVTRVARAAAQVARLEPRLSEARAELHSAIVVAHSEGVAPAVIARVVGGSAGNGCRRSSVAAPRASRAGIDEHDSPQEGPLDGGPSGRGCRCCRSRSLVRYRSGRPPQSVAHWPLFEPPMMFGRPLLCGGGLFPEQARLPLTGGTQRATEIRGGGVGARHTPRARAFTRGCSSHNPLARRRAA
jgi:hypothetical protein